MLFDTKAFGARVKGLRNKRNLTQEQLADILFISASHMAKLEVGRNAPSFEILLSIAFFFDVTTDYLLYGRNTSTDLLKEKLKGMISELKDFEESI